MNQNLFSSMTIDNMLINLVRDCYKIDYADIASHLLQLATQTLSSEPNIVGPYKPPTGKTMVNKMTGRLFNITKKVDEPQTVDMSIWVVRGFYPNTGIPFKMVVYKSHSYSYLPGVKVSLGTFSHRAEKTHVNIHEINKYTQEVAEFMLLDEVIDETNKPENRNARTFRCMTPKGAPKHENKAKFVKPKKRTNKKVKDTIERAFSTYEDPF